jgi:two-component system NtrC family sensor kinase
VHPFLSRPLPVEQIDIESAIAVPLVVKGKLLGSMWVARKPNCPFDEEDLELVTAIGNRVATALENAGLYSRVAEREAHLNSILETSRDGIAVLNQNQRIVFRNSAMSSIFGYDDSDDLAALDTQEFFTPESWSILEDIRRRLAEGCLIDEIIKFKAKRKDGTIFDAEARLGNFMENGERFDVAVLRDMTERNRMDFQLQQSNKLAAIGELAAGVAHEINNPVATVQVQTGLMRDIIGDEQAKIEKPLLSRIEEILDTIEDQVERCQSVTNGLLSFSRTPEGKEGICDINNLVEWTVRFVSDLMDRKATITKNLDGRNPVCPGDPHRLEQVFVNLMTNAWKAAGPKGAVAITTRLDPAGTISIEFADSGPGIPKNVLGRIFEPFFTTNPEGEGTGLGLSISHYII